MINPRTHYKVMRNSGLTPLGVVWFVALMVVSSPFVALAAWATPHQKGFGKFRARERIVDIADLEISTHMTNPADPRFFAPRTSEQLREALLNPDTVRKLVAEARDGGESRVLKDLLETAGELRQNGLLSKEDLSYIVLLAYTRPMTDAQVQELIDRRYPRLGNISVGGVRLRAASPEAAREVMRRDFDAGKREMPDLEPDDKA